MRQEEKVKHHLKTIGPLTGAEALGLYHVKDLPKRISTLRREGVDIERTFIKGRFARYSLAVDQTK